MNQVSEGESIVLCAQKRGFGLHEKKEVVINEVANLLTEGAF